MAITNIRTPKFTINGNSAMDNWNISNNRIDYLFGHGNDWSYCTGGDMDSPRQNGNRATETNTYIGTPFAPLRGAGNRQPSRIMKIFLLWRSVRIAWLAACLLLALFAFSIYANIPTQRGAQITNHAVQK